MRVRAQRLASQTYRIDDYVAFKLETNQWKLGKPIDWEDPVSGGMHEGSVSVHKSLQECKTTVSNRVRAAARR